MAYLKLLGDVSGYTEIKAADTAVPTTFVLPASDGTPGQVLSTDGSATLRWITPAAGGTGSYTLPTASTTVLGGVRVDGTTVSINGSGVISATPYSLPTASASTLGGVKVGDGLTISNGVLSVTAATGGSGSQADSLLVGSQYRIASIDAPDTGTAYTIACRDMDGNLNAAIFQGTATSAQFADLAEKYVGDSNYEPGTVLMFGGTKEVTVATSESTAVAGVVSTAPGFIMNNGLEVSVTDGESTVILALTGRVPCKVKGKVSKGDMLVSAGDGFARAHSMPALGSVIGKSLEDFDGEEGLVEIVVGRL